MTTNQQTNASWFILRFLGSLPLAMILLAVIIVACAAGTVTESHFDAAVAQAYVYDTSWFVGWLLLLCVNLICAVLIRYPWKPYHAGFIITHAGIVVLLFGAMIGRIWGMEGTLTLFKGAQPINELVLNQTVFDVRAPRLGENTSKALNLEAHPPTAQRPIRIKLKDIQVSLVDYAKELAVQTRVEKATTNGSPAVRVALRSAIAPQPITKWLWLGDKDRDTFNLGPAQISFVSGATSAAESRRTSFALTPLDESPSDQDKTEPSREKHFLFAKIPDMSMTRVISGRPSGIKAAFRLTRAANADKDRKGALELEVDHQRFEFLVDQILNRDVPLQGTRWTLNRLKFLPDFRIEAKEPVSVSDLPNNPALVFEIAENSTASGQMASQERDHEVGECDHTKQKACCPQSGEQKASSHAKAFSTGLTIFYDADQKLRFASVARGQKKAEGELEIGKEISLGLADWQVRIDTLVERAVIWDEFVPFKVDGVQPIRARGVLVQVRAGEKSTQQWLASGTPADVRIGNETVHLSFGQRLHPLNFSVALEDFEVERDEGTQNPAGFKSHVRFMDSKNRSSLRREIWMNHPADYPEFPGVSFWGTAYKFSQASWNPNDLNQTTLQVVRDPGWTLKWIGSILLCGGMFTMFYVKPYPRRQRIFS